MADDKYFGLNIGNHYIGFSKKLKNRKKVKKK